MLKFSSVQVDPNITPRGPHFLPLPHQLTTFSQVPLSHCYLNFTPKSINEIKGTAKSLK